jgi:tetratricopeptide (TPR) repeat protein
MKNAWIVSRLDTQIKNQPVDIYFVLDVANGNILSFETVETELSQVQADMLLKVAKTKSSPEKVIIAKGDPAELLVHYSAKKLRIDFKTSSVLELEEFIIPIKRSFGEYFFSPSSLGCSNNNTDTAEEESARRMLPDSYDLCSCASGKKYKFCCKAILREITEAMVAAEEGNLEGALNWIDKARKVVGETAEVLCRESIVYSFFGMEKSKLLLEKCLALNPKHPRAHYLCGIDFKLQGDNLSAINEYKIAIANYPETDHYHLNFVQYSCPEEKI